MRLVQQQTASAAGALGPRSASSSTRVAAALPACVVRGRPFTAISKQASSSKAAARRSVLPALKTAAVDEAPAAADDLDDGDFVFNYTDSKKNNEYSTSDVESAVRFFVDGEGLAPEADGEFVTNLFGSEDAGFFDDIDNNEAYEADEFSVAGIPEAAPKKRGRGRKEGGSGGPGEVDEDDDFNKAREQSRFKAMEDAMVAAAQMEEMGFDKEETEQRTVVGPPVWDWMQDFESSDGTVNDTEQLEQEDALNALVASPMRAVSARAASALPSDETLFSDMRVGVVEELDQDSKDLLEFLVDDFDLEGELKRVDEPSRTLEVPASSEDDLADARALLGADISEPAIDDSLLDIDEDLELAGEDDGSAPLTTADVESYVGSLRAVEGGELTDEESKALFAGNGGADSGEITRMDLSALEEDADSAGGDALLSDAKSTAAEAATTISSSSPEEELDELPTINEEEEDDELADSYSAELASLRATASSVPEISDQELDICEQFLTMGEAFLESEESRRAQLAAAVAAGTLKESVLDEEFEETADVESELLVPHEWEGDEVDSAAFDDDADGENWVERIIDLTRVTKVVKGGKLMGFRCTAVVGNQNGLVGVGCAAGREVATAVKRALVDAKKSVVQVPLVGAGTLPHRMEAKFHSAKMVVLPASEGTGCIAGGSIRSVLELAGVKDCLAKRLGCRSPLNNARCTVKALQQMRTLNEVSAARGVPMSQLLLPRA